jgi:hypothetical protein
LLHKGSSVPKEYEDFDATVCVVQVGRSAWQTKESFEQAMETVILPGIRKRRKPGEPVLLLLDGHSSRINLPLWRRCQNEGIDVVILPSHTSLYIQPLDLGSNAAFKRELARQLLGTSPTSVAEARAQLYAALLQALHAAMSPATITSAFRRAGLHPVNPEVVRDLWPSSTLSASSSSSSSASILLAPPPPRAAPKAKLVDVSRIGEMSDLEVRHYAQLFHSELKSRLARAKAELKKRGAQVARQDGTQQVPVLEQEFGALTTPEIKTRATKTGKLVEYFEYSGKLVTHESILSPWEEFVRSHGSDAADEADDEEDEHDVGSARIEAAPPAPPAAARAKPVREPDPSPDADYQLPRPRRGSYKARGSDPLQGLQVMTVQVDPSTKKVKRTLRPSSDASSDDYVDALAASLAPPGDSDGSDDGDADVH